MVRKTRSQESEVRSQKNEIRESGFKIPQLGVWRILLLLLTAGFWHPQSAIGQQPQAQSGQPIYPVNAKYTNGVAPGYWPTAGTGLTLNLSAGTAFCGNPPAPVNYAGGTLALTASQTNYVFLDPSNNCAPGVNTTGFAVGQIPLAKVVTGASSITSVTDERVWFAPLPCAVNSAGAVTCAALGSNQNINLTPTGTGSVLTQHLDGVRISDQFSGGSASARADAAANDIGTPNAGFIFISPTESAGTPTTTATNLGWLDLRLGTSAAPSNNRKFAYPNLFLRLFDNSPQTLDTSAMLDNRAAPMLRMDAVETGNASVVPGYFSLKSNSTTANNAPDASNIEALLSFASINSTSGTTHSGVWGLNAGASLDALPPGNDASMFGMESNIFNNIADSGSILPGVTGAPYRPRFGIVSTSNGTFSPHLGFLVTSSSTTNKFHYGYVVNDAVDAGILVGIAGGSNPVNMTYGVQLAERNTATASNNYSSVPQRWVSSYWTGSGPAEGSWTALLVPRAGANPIHDFKLQFNGTDVAKFDSTGGIVATTRMVGAINTVTFSATPTFDASLGNAQKLTLTGNVTSATLVNAVAGQRLTFILCQDAVGGRTFAWPTTIKGGTTIGSTPSTCSAQSFIFDGTNAYATSPGVTNM